MSSPQAFPPYGSYETISTGGDIAPVYAYNLQLNPPQIYAVYGDAQTSWYSLFGDPVHDPENAYSTFVQIQGEHCCRGNGGYFDITGPRDGQYTQIANAVVDGVECMAFKTTTPDAQKSVFVYYYAVATNLTQAVDEVDATTGEVIIHTKYSRWSTQQPPASTFDSTGYPCNVSPLPMCGGQR
jgi:hypothetical protein